MPHDDSNLNGVQRLCVLLLNCLPLLHAVAVGLCIGIAWTSWPWRLLTGLAVLYLVPPLAARCIRMVLPIREGHIAVATLGFFTWWALFNLQVIFCRLPALEECLRLVPGLYSCWLRLWGARVGRLTYWAAGLRILDRSFLHIGDDVIFGAAVRLNPHVLARNDNGRLELILATVRIGDRAVIGGYSLLTAGSQVAADECTRAFLVSPPFGQWQDGRRVAKTETA
ncbi:MAG: acyl transferase [Verrucomicrobiia bacterium]|jgi:hypothetical protein